MHRTKYIILPVLIGLALVALAHAAEYGEARVLDLDAEGLNSLRIQCGAGELTVRPAEDVTAIRVDAKVGVRGADEAKAQALIEKYLKLTLEKKGSSAVLVAEFPVSGGWFSRNKGATGWVDLTVAMPPSLNLHIEDGSGNMDVRGAAGSVDITDGSGNMLLKDIGGDVEIQDGSGDIQIANAGGAVRINDGSGNIVLEKVAGDVNLQDGSGGLTVTDAGASVHVRDGSGNVTVRNAARNVSVADGSGNIALSGVGGVVGVHDGSGGLTVEDVQLNVDITDGSGDIKVARVGGDVTIHASGSGGCRITDVAGKVVQND